MPLSRRQFIQATATMSVAALTPSVYGAPLPTPTLTPIHDAIVCPWSPRHPRHDHQLIFPLDEQRLMLVWCEYVDEKADPDAVIGSGGTGDEVPCQITSMISTDRGRTWGERRVLQENRWKHNVKHPNLIRLSETEVLFSYVGWDSAANRNVYMRRSTDNCATFGEEVQISEPGWYCNNADRAVRLSTGRVLFRPTVPTRRSTSAARPMPGAISIPLCSIPTTASRPGIGVVTP